MAEWSPWTWDAGIQRHYSTRVKADGTYEYAYNPPYEDSTSSINPAASTNVAWKYNDSSSSRPGLRPRRSTQDSADYTTASSSMSTITQGIAETSLTSIGSGLNSMPIPRAHVSTANPNRTEEKFDKNYRKHAKWEFKWGRVFKVLWSEPRGAGEEGSSIVSGGTVESVRKGKHGEKFHEKVRRFVIIDRRDGHCICLPIMSYGGRGTAKPGVHAHEHAIIYTDQPYLVDGEQPLEKIPIRVMQSSPQHKLEDASRLNYAKVYTVEYNVKVWFIGQVHKNSEWYLVAAYNEVHPLLPTRGSPPTSANVPGYNVTYANTPTTPSNVLHGGSTTQTTNTLYANTSSNTSLPRTTPNAHFGGASASNDHDEQQVNSALRNATQATYDSSQPSTSTVETSQGTAPGTQDDIYNA